MSELGPLKLGGTPSLLALSLQENSDIIGRPTFIGNLNSINRFKPIT